MGNKVHHRYKIGQVIDTEGSEIPAVFASNGKPITVTGPLRIAKLVQRNNRPYYLAERLLNKGGDVLVSQGIITMHCIVLTDTTASPEVNDRSSAAREKEAPPAEVAVTCNWKLDGSVPAKEQILNLLANEVDQLHDEIVKLTAKEVNLLDLMSKVKNL